VWPPCKYTVNSFCDCLRVFLGRGIVVWCLWSKPHLGGCRKQALNFLRLRMFNQSINERSVTMAINSSSPDLMLNILDRLVKIWLSVGLPTVWAVD